jgi:hypothetical protein
MPPKKSGLGRGSRGGKKAKQKRRSAVETGGAAERREDLEREIQRLQQRLADAEQQLEENQQGVGAVWAGLTGTHRRRSSIASAEAGSSEGDGDDGESDEEAGGQRAPKRRRLTIETIEHERPHLQNIARQVAGWMGYDTAFGQELMTNWRSGDTRTILVHETKERGKGSPGYANGDFIDTARRLAPNHLKEIEDFRRTSHAEGGVVSVRTIVQHLNEKFAGTGEKQMNAAFLTDL